MPVDKTKSKITVSDIDRAPDTVGSETEDDSEINFLELLDRLSLIATENEELKDENRQLKRTARTIEILDELIEPYAGKAFLFMCAYCTFVALVLVFHGFKIKGFYLEESVLDFLVGSTAATVIGLVGMVLTGIFVGARSNSRH